MKHSRLILQMKKLRLEDKVTGSVKATLFLRRNAVVGQWASCSSTGGLSSLAGVSSNIPITKWQVRSALIYFKETHSTDSVGHLRKRVCVSRWKYVGWVMSGRTIPAVLGKGWRFPSIGPLPTIWSLMVLEGVYH
ncbi:unnamed protein product [Rangifer tarandus platyrhynchus]|uniref:Uncharacterized protein n=1 Tax=Rangifer tarandus platyrhynchus TaxID=3082113 RepID=A0ABN9A6X9_RANTA|nr:unnamed protein product [Rangifer tarandus platyrhynchus]